MITYNKWLVWLLLLIVSFFALFTQVGKTMKLNQFSLQAVKAEVASSLPEFVSSERTCQVLWMAAAQAQDMKAQSKLMPCSPVYMDMIRDLAPTDATLAAQARELYPDLVEPLYWLGESNGGYSAPANLPLYQQIVTEHPKEGLAWCYLGYQYESAGDLQASLEARINCCYNGDPGSNGCANAGRLLEGKQQYQEAIHYYRLSKWGPSQEAAKRLEVQSSTKN